MLTFHYEPDAAMAASQLAHHLTEELQAKQRVVWVVSGGSNIGLEVQILQALPSDQLTRLTCLLADERYGLPGHADSNWQQLAEAGFAADGLVFPAVLAPDLTLDDTRQQYEQVVRHNFAQAEAIICQLGIGGDGHIAGCLPRSASLAEDEDRLVASYDGGTFQRITMTPPALRQATATYAFAYGETKRSMLQRLQAEDLPVSEQPAQLLKQLPDAHAFTDQVLGAAS